MSCATGKRGAPRRDESDLGLFEDAEPEPWERTSEDPEQLEKAQPQLDRRARERTRSR